MRLADYLDTAASRYPQKEALVQGDMRINYREAQRYVHAIAHALRRIPGLEANSHVAILSPNDWRVPLVQLGVNRADFVWLGLHDRNPPEVNAQVCTGMDGRVVFFHSSHAMAVEPLKALLPAVIAWICLDAETAGAPSLERWLESCWNEFPYTPVDRELDACILPTGGTTGPSKGAVHSQHSMEMQALAVSANYRYDETTRMLTIAPLSHAAGHLALALLPAGGTNVIHAGFDAENVVDTIASEGITHLFLPPTVLYMLMAHPAMARADLRSMRCLMIGAAPVSPDKFKEAVRRFGPVVYEGFAQSETLIPVLVKRPTDYLRADGSFDDEILRSSGRATEFMRVEIVDDKGKPLPHGERGEIAVRASQGMRGYYRQPEASAEVSCNGFHLTGDIGVMNSRGYITIVDRKKDMIVTGGFNVYPAEVEAVINGHDAVLDCIVVGVPDEHWGEAIRALIQLKAGRTVSEDELIAYCKRHLGGVKSPKIVEFRSELPRSAVGKLLRREARAPYWQGQWRSV